MNADERFEQIVQETLDKFLENNPEWATFLGFHDPYDKLLSKGSIEKVYENFKIFEEAWNKMQKTIDFNSLNEEHKIDLKVIERAYRLWKFSVFELRMHEKNPEALEGIGSIIFIVMTRNYAPLEKRIEGIVSRIEKLPKYLEEFRESFEKCKPVQLWTEIAIETCQRMPGYFQFLLVATKGRISDKLYERLQKAAMSLQEPLKQHLEWLKSLLPKTQSEWAIGKEKFEKLLKLREINLTSEEIVKLGEKYLKELKEERERLAQQISPGKTVEEVLKEIQNDAPKTFEEALEATRREMERAKRFVVENNIATVDEDIKLYVKETPSFLAPLIPFAALVLPGRFEKTQEGIYIVTRPKKIEDLGKDANYPSIQNTAVHEAYPGHFLQTARSNRHSSFVRQFARATETVEGWAHYCEQMMMEHGFHNSLKSKFMQINDVIFRAVRMIIDVKLACGEMSFDEAVDMLVKETGMSREGAIAEVRRYTQTPGYALSYLLGKHLILKLRDEVKEKMGDKWNEKFFHDVFTANGYLPIALLREIFNQKLAQMA